MVLVWLDWLVFCEYGFSVSALWCPLATPTILLGFLLPWAWGISSWLLQQSTATAPYLGRRVYPHRCHSWPSTWDSSSMPSCAHAATAFQARTLEWVAISLSNAWKWKVKGKSLSHVQLFATPWTSAHQAPLSMGFSRQEYWSGVPSPSPFSLGTV